MRDILDIILTFIAFMIVHIAFLRKFGPAHFIRNAGLILLFFLLVPITGIWGKLVLLSLWNMYIFALICSRNSVSLRILEEVRQSPNKSLTKSEILGRFTDTESLSARLGLMEKNSFVHYIGPSEVELTSKGLFLARAILFARSLFGVRNSQA